MEVQKNRSVKTSNQKPEQGVTSNQKAESSLESILKLNYRYISSHLMRMSATIQASLIENLSTLTTHLFQEFRLEGFHKQEIPTEYIKQSFKNELNLRIKELLLNHFVIEAVFKKLAQEKIPASNYPRLSKIEELNDGSITFHFDISLASPLELKEWKHFSFKSPKRKRYKDLDKQVINFIEQEIAESKKAHHTIIQESDWVYFEAILCDKNLAVFHPLISTHFWIKIKHNAGIDPLRDLFLNKSIDDSFITDLLDSSAGADELGHSRYKFLVTIKSIVKGPHLSLELFRNTFKLKNRADVHNKLMEIFSYRNDQSQRKSIIEEVFHLLLSKHRFEVPKHLILRRQEDLLISIMKQPDYQVYKTQKDFESQLEALAEKQLKEEVLIDQITFSENITVDLNDAHNYLHLLNNKRLREFIYFKPTSDRIEEANTPFNAVLLHQSISREKTLNHLIHVLTH